MSVNVEVIGIENVRNNLAQVPGQVASLMRPRMDRATIELASYIAAGKLSGQVLQNRTGTLRRSIHQNVTGDGDAVEGQVGTNVVYASVHEFGGAVNVPAHSRVSVRGNTFAVRTYTANYPQRSFMRTGYQERRERILETLGFSVTELK